MVAEKEDDATTNSTAKLTKSPAWFSDDSMQPPEDSRTCYEPFELTWDVVVTLKYAVKDNRAEN